MSLLSWMFPAKKPATTADPESSGLSRLESTRPVMRGRETPDNNAQPANRKGERMARRELLYAVVRDAMTRAGVLSSSYKFKVLSLDGRGRQFLVMVDLGRDSGMEARLFAETETMIAQSAKSRHGILVTAVYWRANEYVAVGDPKSEAHREPLAFRPAGEPQPPSNPSPTILDSKPVTRSKYDTIRSDEVAAFRQARASGIANPAAVAAASVGVSHGATATDPDGAKHHGPQSYTLLTGFEDTELSDGDGPELSGTQYGKLY